MDPSRSTPRSRGVIALDGPSGTGKSTVARRLADRLGARYLDTGAMYRAATLAVLRSGVDPTDAPAVVRVVRGVRVDVSTDPAAPSVCLEGAAVDRDIRSRPVTAAVSAVSAVSEVRAMLVAAQRATIEQALAEGKIVVEGRDIGSVVWPEADPKIFLTASALARAERRAGELSESDIAAVAADIERRDRLDSTRAVSPLAQAPDATVVDTTAMSVDDVVDHLAALVTDAAASRL